MLLNLPIELLEKILSFVNFDQVSRCRLVCRRMDYASKRVLNRGYYTMVNYHAQYLKYIKSQLPRRESERKDHRLARHCEILNAIETRMSLLDMTYVKFIEMNLCCFIPGKVLDELDRILEYVSNAQSFSDDDILQELRDLSSMAMEHFEEKIAPALRKFKDDGPKIITESHVTGTTLYDGPSCENVPSTSFYSICGEPNPNEWKREAKQFESHQIRANNEIEMLKLKVAQIRKSTEDIDKTIIELKSLVSSQVGKVKQQDFKIEELDKIVVKDSVTNPPEIKGERKDVEPEVIQKKKLQQNSTAETSKKRQKRE